MDVKEFNEQIERTARFVCKEQGFREPRGVFIAVDDFPNNDVFVHDVFEVHPGPNGEIVIKLGRKINADELDANETESVVSVASIRNKFPALSESESQAVYELMELGLGLNFKQAAAYIARKVNLNTGERRTFEKIGAILGVSGSRANLIYKAAKRTVERASGKK